MQRVYKFGGGVASPDVTEGDASMNYILGGKGANLAEMCRIGLPVPPGFTITCQTCVEYDEAGNNWPDGALDEIEAATRDLSPVWKSAWEMPKIRCSSRSAPELRSPCRV